MYKSKLQQLCYQKRWELPQYSVIKDGTNHNPSCTATVTVGGLPFHSSDHSRTAKEAHNKAAMAAFHHFSSTPSVPPAASDAITKLDNTNLPSETSVGVQDDVECKVTQHGYKNRLHNYAQMRNLKLPKYSYERKGPGHASRFKSRVTIEGKTYESPKFFTSKKEAEQAAAQVACKSLSLNVVQDGSGVYKNRLQELAQKIGIGMPKYETAVSGLQHSPTFVSTVDVEGKSLTGAAAKNKKQAEMNAAKVAYVYLCEYGNEEKSSSKLTAMKPQANTHHALEPPTNVDLSQKKHRLSPSSENGFARLGDLFPATLSSASGDEVSLCLQSVQIILLLIGRWT